MHGNKRVYDICGGDGVGSGCSWFGSMKAATTCLGWDWERSRYDCWENGWRLRDDHVPQL